MGKKEERMIGEQKEGREWGEMELREKRVGEGEKHEVQRRMVGRGLQTPETRHSWQTGRS